MAALSKGSRRRSSSSDSNRSYDSDRESTSSERRLPHRKDSRKNRKTKSPRSSKQDKVGSSHKVSENTNERPPSKMELEAEGIMTQPRVHKHRRTPSKDYQNRMGDENLKPKETPQSPVLRSPKLQAQESQGFSFDGRNKSEQVTDSQQSMSSTFTIDSQNSVLLALSTGGKSVDIENSVDTKDENMKGHRRRRSREMKNEKAEQRGDISDSGSSVSSAIVLSRNVDSERNISGTESPSVRHRRTKDTSVKDASRDDSDTGSLHRSDSTSKRNSAKISPTAGSQGVPVIDGRKRHGSGSRPSSPAHSDVSDSRASVNAGDRRRMPMADLLEQRFSGRVGQSQGSTASSTVTLTQSQVDSSTSDLPPQIPRSRDSKYSSLENLSTKSSHDYKSSPTERYSPTGSERRRTSSTCSESEIPSSSSAARQLDMDSKNSNTNPGNTGIVAKLLQKLQNFSKSQEESLQTTKYKRTGKSGESKEVPRKPSGDSDSSEVIAGQGTVHSDSSGAHSDDSQQVTRPSYRTHRRYVLNVKY